MIYLAYVFILNNFQKLRENTTEAFKINKRQKNPVVWLAVYFNY